MINRLILASAFLLSLLLPVSSWAAVAYDAASSAGVGAVNTISWSHTCTGSDRVLSVGVYVVDTTGGGPAAVTGITYNGVAMTFVRRKVGTSSNMAEQWQLVGPATGANTVVVTLNQTPTHVLMAGAISLTGVDQSTPVDASNDAASLTGQPSLSVTTVQDNAFVVDIAGSNQDNSAGTAGGSQVKRYGTATASRSIVGSTLGPVSPAGATTISWAGFTSAWIQVATSFRPVSAGGATVLQQQSFPMGILQ